MLVKRCGVRLNGREAGLVTYFDVLGARRITPPSAFEVFEDDETGSPLATEVRRQTES